VKYFVIGDTDTVLGFGMVGVDGRVARNVDEAEAAFNEAVADTTVGILVINERTAELIRQRVDRLLFTADFPLVLEIPDRTGRMPDRPAIRGMVNAAIGIKLG
jgi:V/A-type H+-transporting ATPase subunit F